MFVNFGCMLDAVRTGLIKYVRTQHEERPWEV